MRLAIQILPVFAKGFIAGEFILDGIVDGCRRGSNFATKRLKRGALLFLFLGENRLNGVDYFLIRHLLGFHNVGIPAFSIKKNFSFLRHAPNMLEFQHFVKKFF